MGLISSSTLDLYRLVRVPLVSVIGKTLLDATSEDRESLISQLSAKFAASFNAFTPAYAKV